jgi:hypothetical protein
MKQLASTQMPIGPTLRPGLIALLALALPGLSFAQGIESRALTDRIYRGDGVIDLLKNISGNDLAGYFNQTGGLLLLGADVNEDASGNESSRSVGVAIKQAQLSIRTTEGDFTFKDFFTSTASQLREAGSSNERDYSTLFGQTGSSQITGTGSLDISKFDDVMWFEKVAFKGAITSAKLSISFLPTPTSKATANESFFDFSGGFEDFALFNAADSVLVEEAKIGMAAAPSGIKYATEDNVIAAIKDAAPEDHSDDGRDDDGDDGDPVATGGTTPVTTPPAAPAPPLVAIASMGLLMLWKKRNQLKSENV